MNDKDKILEAYIATSSYTIMALEDSIDNMKVELSLLDNPKRKDYYEGSIKELERYLATITYLD